MFNALISTKHGWVGIAFSRKGVSRLNLPVADRKQAQSLLGDGKEKDITESGVLAQQVREYFQGGKSDFDCRMDLSGATPFQRRVWKATRAIPYGEVRSYKWVAQMAGSPLACRAVGNALASNPLPLIIPCHRVVCSDGRPGGFGGKAGDVASKLMLLELEGALDPRLIR
ncbi:MAG: methylated-DNA--[protein]-cysteine S-methyltransferase [Dehalococcoidia bacterium]